MIYTYCSDNSIHTNPFPQTRSIRSTLTQSHPPFGGEAAPFLVVVWKRMYIRSLAFPQMIVFILGKS